MPKFVLLCHVCPPGFGRPTHWDLMLEAGDVLRTWSLVDLPRPNGGMVEALQLPDHRLEYLSFEGPLSGERGHVSRTDAGTYEPLLAADDHWKIRVCGCTLTGTLELKRVDDERWIVSLDASD